MSRTEHLPLSFAQQRLWFIEQRDMSVSPLFQVMFVLQNAPIEAVHMNCLTMSFVELLNQHIAKFDLTLYAEEKTHGLQVWFEYNSDLFDESTITYMMKRWRHLLEAIVEHPDMRIAALPLSAGAGVLDEEELDELFS